MDEVETGQDPPLPPGYVSLAQLQERWIRNQQEENLKARRAEEKRGAASGTTDPNQNLKELRVSSDKKMKGKLLQAAAPETGKIKNKVEISKAVIVEESCCEPQEIHEAVLPKIGVEERTNANRKGRRGGGRGNNRYRHGLKDNRVTVLKVNNVELESEEKHGDGILDVCEAIEGLNVIDEHELLGNNNARSEKIDDPTIEEDCLSNNKMVLKKAGDENWRARTGMRRYWSKSRSKIEDNRAEEKSSSNNKFALEKELGEEPLVMDRPNEGEIGKVITGFRRNRSRGRSKIEDNQAEEKLSCNNKIALEKEVGEEPLVMDRPNEGEIGKVRTVYREYMSDRRGNVEVNRIVEDCLGKKVEEKSLDLVVIEKPQNGDNRGGRKEFRRYPKNKGNTGRFRDNDWEGNVISKVEPSGRGRGRFRGFEDNWRRRHMRDEGRMVWMRKEEKQDADDIVSSEICANSK